MQRSTLIGLIIASILVLITLPFYFTIAGLSFMAFDGVDPGMRAVIFVTVVVGLCILIPSCSLFWSIRLIRRGSLAKGIAISTLPVVSLGIFWIWLAQQSFT